MRPARTRRLPQRGRKRTGWIEDSDARDDGAMAFLTERPEHRAEVAVARALVALRKVAPDLKRSLTRAIKYANALDLVEATREKATS